MLNIKIKTDTPTNTYLDIKSNNLGKGLSIPFSTFSLKVFIQKIQKVIIAASIAPVGTI